MKEKQEFELIEVEVETVRRAAEIKSRSFDPKKTSYTTEELREYGLVREGYNHGEIQKIGIKPQVVTSFDDAEKQARSELQLDTPFGSGIEKWQLPIDMMPVRVAKTVFPKNTKVDAHVHPESTKEDPGGGLRMIAAGSVLYGGKKFLPGDWFFVPNGEPYEFTTDENEDTVVFYTYRFFGAIEGNRFSHPH